MPPPVFRPPNKITERVNMAEPQYEKLSEEELIDLFRDETQPDEVRDRAYREANKRREASMNKRHSEDDEPET